MLELNDLSPFDPAVLALFEAMPEPVWLSHPDGRIAFVSEKGLALLRMPREDVLENGWMHLLHPDDREAVIARVMHTLQTGEPFEAESRMSTPDGSYVWIRSRATALRRSKDGPIQAFLGHVIDIDKYRASELQARAAESRLRRLIDSPLIGFLRLGAGGELLECNDAFASMLGYSRSELVQGCTTRDLTPPEWHEESARNMALVAKNGVCGPFHKEYSRREGRRVPVLIVGAQDPNNEREIVSYILDLSAQTEYKKAFEEAASLNTALLDSMPLMFWQTGADGKVTYFNRWFYDYTGLSPEETLAGAYWDAIHPDDRRRHEPRWETARTVAVANDQEVRYRRAADGSFRWHLIHSEPLRDAQGTLEGWFGFCIDIHDRRRAAERSSFLISATGRLSNILDPDALFECVTADCVPAMADCAQFYLLSGEQLELSAQSTVTGFNGATAIDAAIVRRAIETGTAVHEASAIVMPLLETGELRGALVALSGPSGRAYDSQDVQTLQLLSERLAVIVQNARRFAREHRVAEALQRASLPQSLPSPRGIELHAWYAAAASDAHIGGDWYDALELSDGRVVLSIGDVTGRGLEAAVTMANIRQIIRGIAHVHPDPALMLEAADRALRAEHPETYVTAFACVIDPIESSVVYAGAGHPPGLLRKADGRVIALVSPGLPLGLRTKSEPAAAAVPIDRGDALVLYTDGLTEVARRPLEGEQMLREALADGAVLHQPNPAQALHAGLVGDSARDDVAILIAQIGELLADSATRTLRRWSADAHDEHRIRAIRTALLSDVCFSQLDDDTIFRVEMIVGELVGNVLRHTPGPLEVVLERRRRSIVLHVLDTGEGFGFVPHLPMDAYSERGRGLFIASQLADDFSITRRPGGGSHARAVIAHR